jgi:4-diphosphocytidyl-2-C-methyl-D-erythritol kinase
MGIDCSSFSKINIGLKILGQRKDGFHNINTIFQELQFGDTISIEKSDQGCNITSDVNWIPNDKSNFCYNAYEELVKKFPDIDGVKIIINKNVPVGSGLGGGSANAAAVLKGICKLFDLGISNNELKEIALNIGADVPFFINGGTQLGKGIGEILKPINNPIEGFYLLVIPNISISTEWAYSQIKNKLNSEETLTNFAGFSGGKNFSPELFENDFERVVIPTYPEIGSIKEKLIEFGAMFASLSGSGSTVYGIFSDDSSAEEAELFFQDSNMTILTEPT